MKTEKFNQQQVSHQQNHLNYSSKYHYQVLSLKVRSGQKYMYMYNQ